MSSNNFEACSLLINLHLIYEVINIEPIVVEPHAPVEIQVEIKQAKDLKFSYADFIDTKKESFKDFYEWGEVIASGELGDIRKWINRSTKIKRAVRILNK